MSFYAGIHFSISLMNSETIPSSLVNKLKSSHVWFLYTVSLQSKVLFFDAVMLIQRRLLAQHFHVLIYNRWRFVQQIRPLIELLGKYQPYIINFLFYLETWIFLYCFVRPDLRICIFYRNFYVCPCY